MLLYSLLEVDRDNFGGWCFFFLSSTVETCMLAWFSLVTLQSLWWLYVAAVITLDGGLGIQ